MYIKRVREKLTALKLNLNLISATPCHNTILIVANTTHHTTCYSAALLAGARASVIKTPLSSPSGVQLLRLVEHKQDQGMHDIRGCFHSSVR